jgi:hypothetical protein
MCKKILYLCACGHYTRQSTRALCLEAYDESSTPSPTSTEASAEFRLSTDSQGARNMLSPIRTSWDVDGCRALRCIYRKRDSYWKKRWCEECRGRGIRARERLIKEFGFLEEQKSVSPGGVIGISNESEFQGQNHSDPGISPVYRKGSCR